MRRLYYFGKYYTAHPATSSLTGLRAWDIYNLQGQYLYTEGEAFVAAREVCTEEPYGDGNGLGPDGVVEPGDKAHCAVCALRYSEKDV